MKERNLRIELISDHNLPWYFKHIVVTHKVGMRFASNCFKFYFNHWNWQAIKDVFTENQQINFTVPPKVKIIQKD